MAELTDWFLNDTNYSSTSYVTEWINQSVTNSLYITTYCSLPYTVQLDYAVDSDYQIIYSETHEVTELHKEFPISVYKRFVRLSILNLSPPVDLKVQTFFRPTSIIGSQPKGSIQNVSIPQIQYGAFGSVSTYHAEPKRQYIFANGTGGFINPKSFFVPYSDINAYDSLGNARVEFVDGVIRLIGFNVVEKAYITGSTFMYRAGQGITSMFTGMFFQGAKSVSGLFCTKQVLGMGNMKNTNIINNGLFFGYWDDTLPYEPDSFGILYANDGVYQFVPRTQWNLDKADGKTSSLEIQDWEKLNVFKTDIQYLGAGNCRAYIENKKTGEFVQVHEFEFPGTVTKSIFSEPSFGYIQYQEITTSIPLSATDFIGSASYGLFLEGEEMIPFDRFSVDNIKTISTEQNLISLRCDTTWYGGEAYNNINVDLISGAADGTKNVIIRVYRNCILNAPVWVPIYQNYINTSCDKAGTFGGLGTGFHLYTFELGKVDSLIQNLSDHLHTYLNVGDILTITGESSANSDVSMSICFHSK
jgi:hypothetical protein